MHSGIFFYRDQNLELNTQRLHRVVKITTEKVEQRCIKLMIFVSSVNPVIKGPGLLRSQIVSTKL